MLDCFQHLTFSKHPWRYYQYYSGFDLPLKTNLQMVRIFKQLNGSVIGEATLGGRLRTYKRINNDTILPIRKASMGVLISREAANDALKNATNHRIIDEALQVLFVALKVKIICTAFSTFTTNQAKFINAVATR